MQNPFLKENPFSRMPNPFLKENPFSRMQNLLANHTPFSKAFSGRTTLSSSFFICMNSIALGLAAQLFMLSSLANFLRCVIKVVSLSILRSPLSKEPFVKGAKPLSQGESFLKDAKPLSQGESFLKDAKPLSQGESFLSRVQNLLTNHTPCCKSYCQKSPFSRVLAVV